MEMTGTADSQQLTEAGLAVSFLGPIDMSGSQVLIFHERYESRNMMTRQRTQNYDNVSWNAESSA